MKIYVIMYEELIQFFGKLGTKYFGKKLLPLKELVEKSNLPIIYEKYIGKLFFYCFLSINIFLVYFLYLFIIFWKFNFIISFLSSIILTMTLTSLIATIFYVYPFYKYNKQLEDIERNMPLGISYMNIIASSGVPPKQMFRYLGEAKEFGEFAKECERIYKYINFVGKDVISSVKEVAFRTPSEKFRDFLLGYVSTMSSGGNINLYLNEESKKGIGIYRERQEKYTSMMGFLADVFTVVLIIAPIVIVIILTSFSLIEPVFFSFEIKFLIKLITYVFVPLAGTMFLIILKKIRI